MDKTIIQHTKRFFSGTLLSRISGMGRDLAMAMAFGDHASVAAFMVAFRFSNLLRRLLGEGPLQSAFIPYFEGLRVNDKEKSSIFFQRLFSLLALLLIGIILVVEIGFKIALSTSFFSEGAQEILHLTAWLFPGILFICLYGINISLLNCHDSFFIPSFAPFICNTIWIVGAIVLKNQEPTLAMIALSKWVLVGFFCQWLLTMPFTYKCISAPLKEWFKIEIPQEIWTLIKSFSFGAIGVGAVQINAFIDAIFARYADVRGPVYLWYSIRLEQLALAIFGIACVSTIVPRLSRAIKSQNWENAKALFSFSYKRIMVIMIPCTFAILSLGLSTVNLIYGRGNFLEPAVIKTSLCLFAYGIGLVPTTLIMLFSTIYYAQGNFKLPMIISILTVVLNVALNSLFVFGLQMGSISIAIATSFSAWINCFILEILTDRMGWKTNFSQRDIFQIVFVSVGASLFAALSDYLFFDIHFFSFFEIGLLHLPKNFLEQITHFITELVFFIIGFFGFAVILKSSPILDLIKDLVGSKPPLPVNDVQR